MDEILEPQMNYVGKKLAYYSALIGTLIFLTYLLSKSLFLMIAGVVFILGAGIVNVLVLAVILIELICNQTHWRSTVVTIICMLLNIPLVILYLFILSYFHL
ncbi:hypothetical protein SAMN04488024_106148 [Pedobacter soli]|uniref:Branched-chain amino acid:cation transporter, LIVCS family n=1 Tax=Pedobacter soli TaxID=390242 RepID=A0A1G6VI88_9SPHI|nr:hypothetical protein SAMN04488024_106148 [Pedobacter soli]